MNLRIFAPQQLGKEAPAATIVSTFKSQPVECPAIPVPTASAWFYASQRIVDVALTCVALLFLLVPCIIIALAIKLESKGSILFRQKRVGQNGELFWFYKFRSMVADAEAQRNALMQMNEASGPLFKIKNDPRITRVGRFIRKYSLDELPQLLNVLTGEMSLVGPRPALPAEVEQYSDRQRARLSVRPGITGLWQVSGRSDLSFERSVELDIEYVTTQSMPLYFRILVMTIPAVLKGRGAY
ncbi:MAG TPA: sugar transferase [Capsulimonadaceae bacterium]|jgi:lipopolysaccharide/colanic/teichoic acid biosynthesis glycosyltransferase